MIFLGEAGRKIRRGGAASRTREENLSQPPRSGRECFCVFRGVVCRRRCPSGRRPQAPQRPTDFRKAHRRNNSTGAAGTSLGGGWRLWSEAEPACLEVVATNLNDPRGGGGCGKTGFFFSGCCGFPQGARFLLLWVHVSASAEGLPQQKDQGQCPVM